jgi:general secretion pathway protein D
MSSRTLRRVLWNLLAALLLAGCVTTTPRPNPIFEEGRAFIEAGRLEEGLARVQEAARQDPGNHEIRAYYFRARDAGVAHYLAIGDAARGAGRLAEAEDAYKHAQALDTANARAKKGLESVGMDARHRAMLSEAQALLAQNDAAAAYAKARAILAENASFRDAQALVRKIEEVEAQAATAEPRLGPALKKPVTMEFRDAPLRSVFELIAQHTGLNVVFDRDVRADLRATVFVRDTSVEDVIRFVLVTNGLERKVLNDNTLLVYPNTPAKVKDYRDLVMRSFYLGNADAKQTANMIKTMVKTPDLFVDDKLNMVVIRDTPEAVRIAERLVMNQDLAEPEVMLEVEVMEVGTNLLTELGVQWPDRVSLGLVGAAGAAGTITLPEWLNRSSDLVRITTNDPFLAVNLKKQNGRTNVLANPRIRVKNRDKAKVHIGDRVPVITTTASATGFVAESVNYLDVGLKLEVEPSVYLENDVGIKVGLEVSNIAQQIRTNSGTVAYQVGTRNASTTLRLKDGETQVLAGLINDEDRRSAARVPGLGDMPVLEHLFGSTSSTANKTEVVLLITPHVVRNLSRPQASLEEFQAGTDARVGAAPLTLPRVTAPAAGAAK